MKDIYSVGTRPYTVCGYARQNQGKGTGWEDFVYLEDVAKFRGFRSIAGYWEPFHENIDP